MSTADILRGPHLRDLVEDGGSPMLVVQPLRFIPVRYVPTGKPAEYRDELA